MDENNVFRIEKYRKKKKKSFWRFMPSSESVVLSFTGLGVAFLAILLMMVFVDGFEPLTLGDYIRLAVFGLVLLVWERRVTKRKKGGPDVRGPPGAA